MNGTPYGCVLHKHNTVALTIPSYTSFPASTPDPLLICSRKYNYSNPIKCNSDEVPFLLNPSRGPLGQGPNFLHWIQDPV